jgi:hypothetical protein
MAVNFIFSTSVKSATSQGGHTIQMAMFEAYTVYTTGYAAYVGIRPTFDTAALDGTETIKFDVYRKENAGSDTLIGTKTVTVKNNVTSGSNYNSGAITYASPSSLTKIYVKATFAWNASTSVEIKTEPASVGTPYLTSCVPNSVSVTSCKVTLNSNVECDIWQYRVGTSGGWTTLSTSIGTHFYGEITSLTPNASHTIYFRVRRRDMQNWSGDTEMSTSIKTLGAAEIIGFTPDVAMDVATPLNSMTLRVYDTSYSYAITVVCNGVIEINERPITVSSSGDISYNLDLSSVKNNILQAMSSSTSADLEYILTTTINNVEYTTTKTGIASVSAARSAPAWNDTTYLGYEDVFTQNFFEDTVVDPTIGGYINNETELGAWASNGRYGTMVGASAKNGATIVQYYLIVGGIKVATTTSANGYVFMDMNSHMALAGETVEVIYGVIDSRGFKTESVFTVPVRQYTPIRWVKSNIARDNYYGTTINFDIEAQYTRIDLEIGGVHYINGGSYITIQYSEDGGTTWSTGVNVNGVITNTSVSYVGSPLPAIPNDKEILVRIRTDDAFETTFATIRVPTGKPLIHFENGKIVINGDLEINGDLTVNGTIINNPPSPGDLTGTTWQFVNDYNEWSEYPFQEFSYTINFTSNGNNYTLLTPDASTGGYALLYDTTTVYRPSGGPPAWVNQNYRTIAITGGADTGSTVLREWLEANATQIS